LTFTLQTFFLLALALLSLLTLKLFSFQALSLFSGCFLENQPYCSRQPLAITVETGVSDQQGVPSN
jgi:hypothetical protein